MGFFILLAFIAVPLIEIGVFIEVGDRIGLWPTLGVVVLTAIIGTWLLRLQGLSTLRKAQSAMEQGQMPIRAVFDGACLLVAGALLLTPGFVTDALGGLLFLPPFRSLLLTLIAHRLARHVHVRSGGSAQPGDGTIEGEWEELREWPEISPAPAADRPAQDDPKDKNSDA